MRSGKPRISIGYRRAADMEAILTRTKGAYIYTYDQFTVFFYDDHVYIGGKEYPIRQCCVDVLNLDDAILEEINQRVKAFVPAARNLLTEKTDSAAAFAQERLNAVWDLIFTLPVYRDLPMDEECNRHTFQRLMADDEKWAQMQDFSSEGYAFFHRMLADLARFADSLCGFR